MDTTAAPEASQQQPQAAIDRQWAAVLFFALPPSGGLLMGRSVRQPFVGSMTESTAYAIAAMGRHPDAIGYTFEEVC